MPEAGFRISTSPIGFQDRIPDSSESAPTRRTPALHTRRSVSSMKGLLPLTLSSSCSSLRSQLPPEEGMDQRVDDYLPEVLARDLELSKAIFEARSMTAGAPIPTITPDYMATRSRAVMYPHRMSSPSPYQTASARVQSLGAIEEQSSMVSFIDQQEELQADDTASDLDSLSGTEASSTYDAEPPSFRVRQQSIVTNATSLASTNWRPSSKCSQPPSPVPSVSPKRLHHESSWIDNDSDGEDDDVSDYDITSRLSSRRPALSLSEMDIDLDATPNQADLRGPPNINNILHRKSYSVGGGAPLKTPQKQPSGNSIADTTWRPKSAAKQQEAPSIVETEYSPSSSTLHRAALIRSQQQARRSPVPTHHSRGSGDMTTKAPSGKHSTELSLAGDEDSELDDDLISTAETQHSWQRASAAFIRPSPPPSPLSSVQTWLHGSNQPYALPFQGDELARVMPLPPDVIETLRISTACFPETMLLSSSLTIETIRSYSKKVRHPSVDATLITPPQSPGPTSKTSLWRRVVKRGSHSSHRSRDSRSSIGSNLPSPSSSSLEPPKPWASIKNVFGSCSDYICDAMYAHIVAYNYISALVARNPPPSVYGRRTPTASDSQNEDIPKKAASLLGLNLTPGLASGASNRIAKRLSSTLPPWAKEEMMAISQPSTSSSHDASVRSIQAELLLCIRRLIGTARLMAETGSGEERMVDMEAEDPDILFMRSLCEMVQISEEAAYSYA